MKHALILFAHGARDPRWAAPFERLREIAQAQLPDTEVVLAFLELMSPRLPEAVAGLAQNGCTSVSVVPVFLGQGGHVLRDGDGAGEGDRAGEAFGEGGVGGGVSHHVFLYLPGGGRGPIGGR